MFKQILAALAALFLAAAAHAAIDANKATQAELEAVKGIGPSLSTVILSERKKGDFKDWSDFVARVPGVGERSAAKFSDAGLTVRGDRFSGVVAGASAKPAAKSKRAVGKKSDQGPKPAPASKAQPAPAKS